MNTVIELFQTHSILAYPVLFLVSYFETFIGIGFFIYGEIFFIAGAMLAGAGVLNIWLIATVLYLGGILGDTSSYLVGSKYGINFFRENRKIFNLKNYEKGRVLFRRYGNKSVFFARFMGPLSWVTPFLAGVYKMPYRSFIGYNALGVVLAISQFLIIGYTFGANWQYIFSVIQHNVQLSVCVLIIGIFLYLVVLRMFKNKD